MRYHGALARSGKVKRQTPKVDPQPRKKKLTGYVPFRIEHNRGEQNPSIERSICFVFRGSNYNILFLISILSVIISCRRAKKRKQFNKANNSPDFALKNPQTSGKTGSFGIHNKSADVIYLERKISSPKSNKNEDPKLQLSTRPPATRTRTSTLVVKIPLVSWLPHSVSWIIHINIMIVLHSPRCNAGRALLV